MRTRLWRKLEHQRSNTGTCEFCENADNTSWSTVHGRHWEQCVRGVGERYLLGSWKTLLIHSHHKKNHTNITLSNTNRYDDWFLFTLRALWYWVLATPVCAIIFGSYLAFSVCVLEIHWNEGFSSLQSFNFKNFCRIRIDRKSGDLEVFAIGLEKTWNKWTADRRRNKNLYPSRWRPEQDKIERPKIVDYLRIPAVLKQNNKA